MQPVLLQLLLQLDYAALVIHGEKASPRL
jgi:hypothetical protein